MDLPHSLIFEAGLAHIPKDTHKKHPTGKSRRGVYMLSIKTCLL
ncbi:hypothetical protein ATORI0001_0613 [Lancefieldella rimae ATCC 49626]|uniref:Uncharacterized protein n=1 Tax=Lancefieldella rimae (strain ATCC 49626 / DSM 7090 / CCUG 31168 / NBRC 15546 / VPI D140H-11A) TaxID=553184 RepID=B9CKQ6_LANR4|nr:hypothetical protein ATORI0001_0613 [Lancefieldella rimae ATCC 49626]